MHTFRGAISGRMHIFVSYADEATSAGDDEAGPGLPEIAGHSTLGSTRGDLPGQPPPSHSLSLN